MKPLIGIFLAAVIGVSLLSAYGASHIIDSTLIADAPNLCAQAFKDAHDARASARAVIAAMPVSPSDRDSLALYNAQQALLDTESTIVDEHCSTEYGDNQDLEEELAQYLKEALAAGR